MIKNEKQYAITKIKRDEFSQSLLSLENSEDNGLLKEVMINAVKSQIESFTRELDEYENLKNNQPAVIFAEVEGLPEALIKIRIAKGLSQSELAKRNGMHEQQIQRYEANNYTSANFEKIIGIARSMDAHFERTKVLLHENLIEVKGYDPEFIRQATNKLQSKRSLIAL